MSDIEVRVPDIGDFKDVPVIELLVKPGDRIKKDDPLITLESEKATFEVPSPNEGVVKTLKVNVGDKVSQGSAIIVLDEAAPAATQDAAPATGDDKEPKRNVDEAAQVMEAPAAPADAAASAQTQAAPPATTGQTVELRVPDIGDFTDVPVVEILVKPGEQVAKDASVITLESDKATMEVPATVGGTIEQISVKVGDKVSKGALIATLSSSEPQKAPTDAPKPADQAPQSQPQAQPASVPAAQGQERAPSTGISGNGTVHASPSIRRFARELGVDLHLVKGSGPSGRVTREDVQQHVKTALRSGASAPASAGAFPGIAPWLKIDFAQYGPIESKPLSRIKKLSGPNLHRNWVTIPHVTNNDDADVTDLEAFRQQLNAENAKSGTKVTMLAFLIKAVGAALQKYPEFNASLDGDNLVLKKYYNIGFAADTPGGLIVPVVKDAAKKGVLDIARETAELSSKGREGKLGPADMSGGTFTISSLGGIGGTYFTPIINAPEVAILGVCRSAMRPVWNGSEFAPRLMLPLSLSYDHRVIDGAAAARFNIYLASLLADMRRTLL